MSEIARDEMRRVFNVGLGVVMVCDQCEADEMTETFPHARIVGIVTQREGDRRTIL